MKNLVIAAIAASSIFAVLPAQAQETVSQLNMTFRTGGDDVRGGSIVTVQLIGPGGTSEPAVNVNSGRNWRNNSINSARLTLPRPMTIAELGTMSLRISFDGAARNVVDTYDNWNLNSLSISTPVVCSGGEVIANAAGAPWMRMTGERRTATLPMTVPPALAETRLSVLNLTLLTGGDDLRGGAVATATVRLNGGRSYPPIAMNNGTQWPGNSSRDTSLRLPEATLLRDIAGIEINFDGAGRNFGESYDNWNINRAFITMPRSCSAKTLINLQGQPWWRATGQDNTKLVPLR